MQTHKALARERKSFIVALSRGLETSQQLQPEFAFSFASGGTIYHVSQ